MVTSDQFRAAAVRAVRNVIRHGDTDIFPFPFENHAFSDLTNDVVTLVEEYNNQFDAYLARFAPLNVSSLTPVTHSGFRWATQIDPIWNAYLLSCVIALSDKIEVARVPKSQNVVFSYRYCPDDTTGDLFDREFGWVQFMKRSQELASEHQFVIACDISEFYPRLGHHRVENALKQIASDTPSPGRIMDLLSNFSNTRSFGLPIGGPAARVLSELTINQVDRLLLGSGIKFTRFADDYHLFANSREDAYRHLIFISEKLFDNQGLSLQKSKTRILTSAEFLATSPIKHQDAILDGPDIDAEDLHKRQLLRFSLRFDPYSLSAEEDYERLKSEVKKFDIVGLLKEELTKSRVHTALARKIVTAIRYLEGTTKDDAVISILTNCDVLYPIFSSVLMTIDRVFEELSEPTQGKVIELLQKLIKSQSHVLRVDVHLSYAIRVLAHMNSPDNSSLLQKIYEEKQSPLIRRDILLVLAKWRDWYWISDKRNRFREFSGPERRAFIVASYVLTDEGDHWRKHIKTELSPFELFILKWAGERANNPKWVIPL